MKIYPIYDQDGELSCFEIPNIGRSRFCRFIRSSLGYPLARHRKSEEFADFSINGRGFVVMEPSGDNSRYLVGEMPRRPSPELTELKEAFEKLRRFYLF